MYRITKQVKYGVLFLILFISCLSFPFNKSYACDCVVPLSVQEELERNTAVFSGKVVEIVDKNKNKIIKSTADPIAVVFEVKEWWKGGKQTQVLVNTVRHSSSCGYKFTVDDQYLVYAREIDGELNVSICSRTQSLSTAQTDIEALGKSHIPTEKVSKESLTNVEDEQGNSQNVVNYYLIGILFVSLEISTIMYIKQRNKKNANK
ncbi:hypothetical protein [Bacillus massiliigorillae]|uniref:hypothetical protein n=1 Tax=Bacillus massiliigorillae TaxID=1243664 RepID=UPI00039B9DD1|nr:hypothetical protein [Bacillus massiliigorillae]